MTRDQLFQQIKSKGSYLCVGLDTDLSRVPSHLLKGDDPIFEFNKQIIDATIDYAVAYKPNLAFYEAHGSKGLESLEKTIEYIPDDIFTIADAKRGDIGNTSKFYAKAFFENMNFDSITVSPYMGGDSVKPFLTYPDKWAIVLALTSNESNTDIQCVNTIESEDFFDIVDKPVYELVIDRCKEWGNEDNLMMVVGATQANMFEKIRSIAQDYFFLVPGVGAQGGDLEAISKHGMNDKCGMLVNSSRGIIYSSDGEDFGDAAARSAKILQTKVSEYLSKYLP